MRKRLSSTFSTNGEAVPTVRQIIDSKIRTNRKLLAERKAELSPSDYKAARDVIAAQKRLYESILGFKW